MFSFAKKLVDRLEGTNGEAKTDSYFKNALQLNNKGYALRVLNVVPHSLAHQLGFESWFDYVVRINHHELPMVYPSLSSYNYSINDDGSINYGGNTTTEQAGLVDYPSLQKELASIANNTNGTQIVVFDVWSAKGGVIRQIRVPLDKFDAAKPAVETGLVVEDLFAGGFQQIGLTLQSQHLNTSTYVWRILTTHSQSPAFQAQLIPYSDYIIGCDSAFPDEVDGKGLLASGGESLLSRTVLSYYNRHYRQQQEDNIPITLYVYNHDYDILRPVTVNLSRNWGSGHNKGILGCDVGYGLLHRIPEVVGKFDSNDILDDVIFETDQSFAYNLDQTKESAAPPPPADESNTFVPQHVVPPPPQTAEGGSTFVPPPPPPGGRKKRTTKVTANLDELNDYMNEELAKSKESEVQTATGDGSAPPPPPTSK